MHKLIKVLAMNLAIGFVKCEGIPMMTGRDLTQKEMANYKKPFLEKKASQVVFQWPNEIPFDKSPRRNFVDVSKNYQYLKSSKTPIHILHANPGIIFSETEIVKYKRDLPRAKFTFIGEGLHYLQETQPKKISQVISAWVNR